MKKTLILLSLLLPVTAVFSQTRIGIKGGINLSNMVFKASYMGESDAENGTGVIGLNFGLVSDFAVTRNFHIRPELLLVTKGSNLEGSDFDGAYTELKYRPSYLQLPINFIYSSEFPRSNVSLFVGAGPYLAYGIGGKLSVMGQKAAIFSNELMKKFDAGISTTVGIELNNGLSFDLSTSLGLVNTWGDQAELASGPFNIKQRNTSVLFSIGYFFRK